MKKVSGSTTTVYIFSGSKVTDEYDNGAAPASPSREYYYDANRLLAKYDPTYGGSYYQQDLVSNRLVTNNVAAVTSETPNPATTTPWLGITQAVWVGSPQSIRSADQLTTLNTLMATPTHKTTPPIGATLLEWIQ